jgi:hypothetical protein
MLLLYITRINYSLKEMKNMKPNIKPKSKIGKNKFKKEKKYIVKNPDRNINSILFYKYPGEKSKLILGDRFDYFKVIDIRKFKEMFSDLKSKKDLRNRSSFFYFQKFDSRKKSFGSCLPKISSFIDSLFKYPTTKHKYEVIAIINPKNKVIGYTTIKLNKKYMERITKKISDMREKGESLISIRNKLNRIVKDKLSTLNTSNRNKTNADLNLYSILLNLGFEIYFTPETGYKLDKNFNFVKE